MEDLSPRPSSALVHSMVEVVDVFEFWTSSRLEVGEVLLESIVQSTSLPSSFHLAIGSKFLEIFIADA